MAADNKTEQPTPRRRQRAREKGQVARSRDLMGACSGLTATLLLASQMPHFAEAWRGMMRGCIDGSISGSLRMDGPPAFFSNSGLFGAVAIVLGAGWLAAVASGLAQGGIVLAPVSLLPSAARMSPAKKLQQMFSIAALRGLGKSLLPAAAVIYVAALCFQRDWPALMSLPARTSRSVLGFAAEHSFEIAWKSSLILAIWAIVDYIFERRHFESELRMSRQELIDEFKETEGNPQIKGRIRRLQRQMRRRRMLEDVKRAAVVITNPTEFAVALEYRPEMAAPAVVAKGRNLLAAEIKQIARWNNIPMVENPPLAHALYRSVEIGQSIPPKLYTVIAEVLAAIYRAQARAMAAAR